MPSNKSQPAWYAVKTGRQPGVYTSWKECNDQVHKFKGAEYKKCNTEWEAQVYAGIRPNLVEQPHTIPLRQVGPCLFVDGGCNKHTKPYAYGSVVNQDGVDMIPSFAHLLEDMVLIHKELPVGRRLLIQAHFTDVTVQQNNGAELLAAIAGLRIALQTDPFIPRVLSDSELIVQYWSNPFAVAAKSTYMDPRKKAYIRELISLHVAYIQRGGTLMQISGDDNLADLGYHK